MRSQQSWALGCYDSFGKDGLPVGYLDAYTANTFRTDPQGRLVLAPFGRRGKAYFVPPDRAEAFARFQRRYLALAFVALPGAAFALGPLVMAAVIAPLWL